MVVGLRTRRRRLGLGWLCEVVVNKSLPPLLLRNGCFDYDPPPPPLSK